MERAFRSFHRSSPLSHLPCPAASSCSSLSSSSTIASLRCLGPLPAFLFHQHPTRPSSLSLNLSLPRFTPPFPSLFLASLPFLPLSSAPRCPRHRCFVAAAACISSSAFSGAGGGGGHGTRGGGASGGGGSGNGGSDGFADGNNAAQSLGSQPDDISRSSSNEEVILLDVGGMSCGGCASSVKRILESEPHVIHASVNLATETAVVKVSFGSELVHKMTKLEVGEALAKHLSSCGFKSSVRDRSLLTGESSSQMALRKKEERMARLKESGRRLAVACALAAVCLVGHSSHFLGHLAPSWIHIFHSTGFQMSLSFLALVGPGRKLLIDGWRSLLRGSPNMNTLVSLGAVSSFTVSVIAALLPNMGWRAFFEEPVMLLAFVLLGKSVEERAKIQASSDMTSLFGLLPSKANLIVDESGGQPPTTVEVACNNLAVGDKVLVLPGDRIPVDGIVRGGRSTVDESSLTGEPLPVLKTPGENVGAGTINYNGTLVVESERPGGETVIGDVVRMVEEAQSRQAPVQRLADKVAGQFCYGVMALSIATFTFWNTLGAQLFPSVVPQGGALLLGLQLACNVLVIACPCALGLATPTAVLVGTSLGAKRGLLIRGGDVLEKVSSVDTVVFDKTGTLTVGKPVVTSVVPNTLLNCEDINETHPRDGEGNQEPKMKRWTSQEVLALAAGVESTSSHPIAKALVQAAKDGGARRVLVHEGTFEQEPGCGATAIVEGKRVTVGTLEWVHRYGALGSVPEVGEAMESQTVIYVGIDEALAGAITMVDQVRGDAAKTIQSLHRMGVKTYILSGDKQAVAEAVAAQVGIGKERVYGGVRPYRKAELVLQLQKEARNVAMVGDGINDAAALAQSNVGIALASGVGAASEVASVVLMHGRLTQVVESFELSKMTLKKIRQNLWWAFLYNIVGLPVAAGALLPLTNTMLTPSLAGALMGASSLGVMANSLLLQLSYNRSHPSSGPPYDHPGLQAGVHEPQNHQYSKQLQNQSGDLESGFPSYSQQRTNS